MVDPVSLLSTIKNRTWRYAEKDLQCVHYHDDNEKANWLQNYKHH